MRHQSIRARRRCTPLVCLTSVVALVLTARPAWPQNGLGFDAFHCVDVKPRAIATVEDVRVADPLNDMLYDVTEIRELCAPAAEACGCSGSESCALEMISDPQTHLNRYQIEPSDDDDEESLPENVSVTTCLGTVVVDTVIGDKLMVPASKSLASSPAPPDGQSHGVDHFHCYDVQLSEGKLPKGLQITLSDQFTGQPKKFDVVEVDHLCLAADKNGEGIKHRGHALLCYDIKAAKKQPKFKKLKKIYTNDQFGPLRLDSTDEDEACLPAVIEGSAEPVCAGGSCQGGGDCTTQFCSDGVCQQVCAGGSCVCGGDCTSSFCDDSGGSPGVCVPVCASPTSTCVCGGDCTSGFCDGGVCQPVFEGGSCVCGGDCLSGFCDDSGGSPGVCAPTSCIPGGGECDLAHPEACCGLACGGSLPGPFVCLSGF